ncbi:MAG TPA: energy-coupling factor transporter transmembrane component T [Anaerolineae bacterium]|nr:energy-coupling factor transporter transmembrane component T [Anaerolineae bacterium]
MNPRVWAVWVVAASLPALFTRNPLYLTVGLLAVLVVRSRLDEDSRSRVLPLGRLGLLITATATAWNALTVHYGETLLLTLPSALPLIGGPLTLEALIFGFTSGLAVWLLFAAFGTFSAAVTPYQVLSLAPRALRHAGLVVSLALMFFPHALRTAREVREAQAVRGHRTRRWRDLPALLAPLLLNSLEAAAQIAEAMEARGYGRATDRRSGVGWLALLLGATLQLYWRESIAGWIAIALGVGWLIVSGREAGRVTRYRREYWSIADSLVGLALLVSIAFMLLISASHPTALAYYPYPRVMLPPLEPLILLALLISIAPGLKLKEYRRMEAWQYR